MPLPNPAQIPSMGRGSVRVGRTPMSLEDLKFYNPNRPDAIEAIWQPYYDYLVAVQAGQTNLTFFQNPIGQNGKTLADTNMVLAGQFPAPTSFLCTAIMVPFFPGNVVTATGAAGVAAANWLDVVKIANSGYLQLTIGSKPYLQDAPIGKFPPNFTVNGFAALATTVAATNNIVDFARAAGRYYEVTPFLIPQNQNFNITLNWAAAANSSITTAGRIGVIMDGFYYRQSQ